MSLGGKRSRESVRKRLEREKSVGREEERRKMFRKRPGKESLGWRRVGKVLGKEVGKESESGK